MRKSRYDEAEGGEIKRWKLVNTFSAIESISKLKFFNVPFWNINKVKFNHN
jgi:hypothetical protein